MDYPKFFNPIHSLNLFGLKKEFNSLCSLYNKKKLPNVLMLSGSKGSGKSTLVNHFLYYLFDKNNYDKNNTILLETSNLHKQYEKGIFQNIIRINGSDYKSVKVDEIRNLKSQIQQSSILDKDRFIIFDDIELFNTNSLNALLRIIEEPNIKNYFILINNKKKPLIKTIKSRSIEFKIILKEKDRIEIINDLIKFHNVKLSLDPKLSKLSPGNYLQFNYIFKEYDLQIDNNFLENLTLLMNLYKKNKNTLFIDIIFYLADFYFKKISDREINNQQKLYDAKHFVQEYLNKYITFNLSQNSVINAINDKLNNG